MRIIEWMMLAVAATCVATPALAMDDQATYWRFDGRVEKRLAVVLRKVADASLVTPFHRSGIGVEVTRRDLEQRGLAKPVWAEDGHALAAPHRERYALEHALGTVCLRHGVDREHLAPARPHSA